MKMKMFEKVSLLTISCLFLIHSINCIFHYYEDDSFKETEKQARLSDKDFYIISNSNDTLPSEFCLYVLILGRQIQVNFTKIDGLINNPIQNGDVYLGNQKSVVLDDRTSDVIFASYQATENEGTATVIANSDLKSLGLTPKSSNRVYAVITIKGVQISLIPAVFSKNDKKSISEIYILNRLSQNFTNNDIVVGNYDPQGEMGSGELVKSENFETENVYIKRKRNTNSLDRNQKSKRSINDPQNLYVEYLIVLDSTAYSKIKSTLIPTLSPGVVNQYLKIYYGTLVNGVNSRFVNSLSDDTDISINVRLAGILVYINPSDTPWTNLGKIGIPKYRVYNGRVPINSNSSLYAFQSFMNNLTLPFNYDHAVSIINLDLWDTNTNEEASARAAITGLSFLSQICTKNKYSIIEEEGFNNIQNAAHELAHNLGAVHDGTGIARRCSASSNFIMVQGVGTSLNIKNLYFFSSCSINAFKSLLLTPGLNSVSSIAQCLVNVPLKPFSSYFIGSYLPGSIFDINTQCELIQGQGSIYCDAPDDPICQSLYCVSATYGGCSSVTGYGAIDGTPCSTNGTNSDNQICYQGQCIKAPNSISNNNNACSSNPCLNNGSCIQIDLIYLCSCSSNYTGLNCETRVTSTNSLVILNK